MKNSVNPSAKTRFATAISSLALVLIGALAMFAQAPVPDSPAIEAQAHEMVAKLTLEQKIELLGGHDSMFTYAEPSIGLPQLKMSDGPVGVRTWGPTTAYPGGAALAASWDTDLARKIGESLGRDSRARGVHFLLGPGINIARTPLAGRNFEYFSEDPYLVSQLVVPYIEGVQSQGVVATVKHYALNNQEYNRHNVDSEADERTLREIYLPGFEAAVIRAHVDAVMNSYNLVNGSHATQSAFLNLQILKGEWGFQGILMSDWDATYDSVGAANNGLDLEMPTPRFMNAKALLAAVKDGTVKESTIDEKVLRLIRIALRYGFENHDQFDVNSPIYSVADREIALQGARESITLLKNDGGILPLNPAKVKTIAVIGPNAYPAVTGGGGSSEATAFAPVSILTGISDQAGPSIRVLYARGLPDMRDVFRRTNWQGGIQQATYSSKDFSGTPENASPARIADWGPSGWGPADQHPRSIRYTTAYKPSTSGKYLILGAASGRDAYTIQVDGKTVLHQELAEGQVPQSATVELTAGKTVSVVAEYLPHTPGVRLGLGIVPEADLISAEALKIAAAADAVVVAAGFDPPTEGEGHDRTFTLPWGQDALIESVAAANPHTIVTLNGGGGADTQRWLSKVPALLHLYYPGQEGGTALGEILLGKRSPEGKLPVTFDRSWDESASAKFYYPIPGADTTLHVTETDGRKVDYTIPKVKYDDGLLVGYRYWTTTGKHPLYPFGYGLSYTTFSFSNLQAPATADLSGLNPTRVQVSFNVTNTGSVAGAEVAQLYVSDPSATVKRPERELKGFQKVRLNPGETKHVTLTLDARSFSYWDEKAHKWTIAPGKFVIRVGDSSENTPLSVEITLN
jgi:beta-glucosidase